MEAGTILVTGIGLAVAAGLNAYIPLLIAGLLIRFDVVGFGEPYDLLGSTPALVILGVLLAVELLADKIPAVDSVNDVVQTVIRPASGAVLFAGAASGADAEWSQALALILGLVTAASVHATKATVRPVVNVATAGAGAPVVSTVEDGFSVGLSLAALLAPLLALLLMVGLVVWLVVFLRRRAARRAARVPSGGA
ncbi:MAG: DUF4126 domain-containing protein [Candidatus Nanopelagicales bacterium]|jgi:hypothetical protein|nr:DUF4126 domain-containing protein [Candidatus Nanopelagicales bacterium]